MSIHLSVWAIRKRGLRGQVTNVALYHLTLKCLVMGLSPTGGIMWDGLRACPGVTLDVKMDVMPHFCHLKWREILAYHRQMIMHRETQPNRYTSVYFKTFLPLC